MGNPRKACHHWCDSQFERWILSFHLRKTNGQNLSFKQLDYGVRKNKRLKCENSGVSMTVKLKLELSKHEGNQTSVTEAQNAS